MVTNFYGFFNFFAWWSISIFFLFLVLFFPVSMFPFMMIAIIITIDKITFRIRFALVFFVCVLWRFSLKIQDFLFYIIFSYFFISYFLFFSFFSQYFYFFLCFIQFWLFAFWSLLILQKKFFLFSAANFWYSILVSHTIWSYWFKSCSFLISSCFHRDKIFLYTVYEFFDLFIQIVVMFWFWNLQ